MFTNHALVRYGGMLYDPSYGKKYATLQEWEDDALAGIIVKDSSGNLYIQPHVQGKQQTKID